MIGRRFTSLALACALALLITLTRPPLTTHASEALIESVFVHVPHGLAANVPARVLVAFHGLGGNGPSLGRQLMAEADRHHWVIIAPTLRHGDWWNTEVVAHEDVLVSRWLREYLDNFEKERGVAIQSKMLLFGYSRGAGLMDRIALMQPERVVAAAALSSSTYTLPLAKDSSGAPVLFPFGVADLGNYTGRDFNAQEFGSIRWWVGVGGRDDDAKDVPQSWTVHIGPTRLERARAFTSALVLAGAEARLSVFADARHDLSAEMRGAAMTFLHAADPAPLVGPSVTTAVVPTVRAAATPHLPAKAPSGPVLKPSPTSTPVRAASPVVGHTDEALPPGPMPTPIQALPAVPIPTPIEALRPSPNLTPIEAFPHGPNLTPIEALPAVPIPTPIEALRPSPNSTLSVVPIPNVVTLRPPAPNAAIPSPARAEPIQATEPQAEPQSVVPPPAPESLEPAINPAVAQEPVAEVAPPADIPLPEPPPAYSDGSVAPDPTLLP
jgi:poly(3-hydroxybutyrate) depolymerase